MIERIRRVYADTSVFGGIHDEEFKDASRAFFDLVQAGRFRLTSSAAVGLEMEGAPKEVRRLFDRLLPSIEIIETTSDAIELQKAYISAGILAPRWAVDALHVALATLGGTDMIVSWNFQHIVHFDKIRRFNAVNLLHGLNAVEIYSPREVILYEDEDV